MKILSEKHIQQIKADCLYASLYEAHADSPDLASILFKAGNIVEPRTEIDELALKDLQFLTMPIRPCVDDGRPQAVIVSTGSYSPIHAGHIGVVNTAKEYVESLGYQVIQGVLSASHDAYVSIKNAGAAKCHIGTRVQKIYEAIQGFEWLTYDRFEGEGVSCAINFSSVIERIRGLVLANNPMANTNLKVFYVFGSDNAGFADAFAGNDTYQGICVARGGYDISEHQERYKGIAGVHFIQGSDETAWISSTKVRASNAGACLSGIGADDIYLVRTDKVGNEFAGALGESISRHTADGLSVRYFSSNDFRISKQGTISLDKFVNGEYSLDVSRVFELSGGQISAQEMTSLSEPIVQQVSRIPPGEYELVDDDSVSGFTMAAIEKAVNAGAGTITKRVMLIGQVLSGGQKLYDVVDARDFLIGAEKGGLVVNLFGDHVRVPYVFPFVNVVARARILPDKQLAFSREVWALNRLYAGERLISSLDITQRKLYESMGFDGTVGDVCDYYVALIDNYLGSYL